MDSVNIIAHQDGHYSIDRTQVRRLVDESGALATLKVIEALADSGRYPPEFVEQIEQVMFEIELDEQFKD